MSVEVVVLIILAVFAVMIIGGGLYFYIRSKTLNEIRSDVYHLFLLAENDPNFSKQGKQKMKWVLQQARILLPSWMHVFVTDSVLEKAVQTWFSAVKDLLDDGKLNNSIKGE